MEVPCIYKFTGQAKYTELLEKLLDFDNNLSVGVFSRGQVSLIKLRNAGNAVKTRY